MQAIETLWNELAEDDLEAMEVWELTGNDWFDMVAVLEVAGDLLAELEGE